MTIKPLPLGWLRAPIIDPKTGIPTRYFAEYLAKNVEGKLGPTVNLDGQIQATAPVTGRTEGIGTTVQQLNTTGKLLSTDQIAADGTGSPLTGGKRGFQALDTNNRLTNSFHANAVNVSGTPTSATVLSSAGGGATVITVGASTAQYGPSTVSYNSGSFDPGVTGTFVSFADDPTFAGGAVTYQFSATAPPQTAADGRVNFGKITTGAGATTGGGSTGGSTPGGEGGKGYNIL
jgi:hypothetical protein